jgi:Calcineurin-like phosphoesterase
MSPGVLVNGLLRIPKAREEGRVMMRVHRGDRLVLISLLAVTAFACKGVTPAPITAPAPAPPAQPPLAAYVLLVEAPDHSPVPFARVIVASGQPCPTLTGGPDPLAMTKRDNPNQFTVDVCEAVVPFEQSLAVAGSEFTLPAAHRRVNRVAVVGDTGCKPKDQAGCGLDDPEWPFQTLAQAAAASAPDLVLHMGDYNYRGTPSHFDQIVDGEKTKVYYYDAGDGAPVDELCGLTAPYYSQNSTAGTVGSDPDAWEPWWLDFFQPAADLLAAAPWVVARGNHELCSHAGPGWLYFLGPSSNLPAGGGAQLACPPQENAGSTESHLVFVPPQVIALDGLTVAVVDSANACDQLDNFAGLYAQQLAGVAARLDGRDADTAWLIGHRPVWGVEGATTDPPYRCDNQPGSGPAQPYAALTRTLQCALGGGVGAAGAALLPKLDLLLAGHMHRFEWLTFAAGSGRPPQLVVGNSGVLEDTEPPTGSFSQTVDGSPASGFSVEQFGFVQLERDAGGAWSGAVVTPDPAAWSAELPACGSPPAAGALLCVEGLP